MAAHQQAPTEAPAQEEQGELALVTAGDISTEEHGETAPAAEDASFSLPEQQEETGEAAEPAYEDEE